MAELEQPIETLEIRYAVAEREYKECGRKWSTPSGLNYQNKKLAFL